MLTSFLLYLQVAAELLPPLMLWRSGSRDGGRRRVALLCLVWFGVDIAGISAGAVNRSTNFWLEYLLDPVQALILFWLLDGWQTTPLARQALRILLPIYLAGVFLLNGMFDNADHFTLLTGTLTAAVLLGLVLYTGIARALSERSELGQHDWFWFCAGLALYYGLEIALTPVLRFLLAQPLDRRHYLWLAQDSRLVGTMIAMGLLTRGMLCRGPAEPT